LPFHRSCGSTFPSTQKRPAHRAGLSKSTNQLFLLLDQGLGDNDGVDDKCQKHDRRKPQHPIGTEGTEDLKKEIQHYVKEKTAPYKYPRIVEFVDELPKTFNGKIMRKAIRNDDNKKA
jgi:acyl-CoA synthetase (AMP-forming)/AMP-acid ligase II